MRHFGPCLAVTLILSLAAFGQRSSTASSSSSSSSAGSSHSSSSGGSSASSSSSSGSHSSSGGSSASGSSHASGGGSASVHSGGSTHSSGTGSASHSTNVRGSNSVVPAHESTQHQFHSDAQRSIREPNSAMRSSTPQPEKRSFISFLRHPFRRPEVKQTPDIRRKICTTRACQLCPAGQVQTGVGCSGGNFVQRNQGGICSNREVWSGGDCLLTTHFLDDCNGLRMALERQARRMESADALRRNACGNGVTMECSSATQSWQSEDNLYRSLRSRYQVCQQRATRTFLVNPTYGSSAYWDASYGSWQYDSLNLDANEFSLSY